MNIRIQRCYDSHTHLLATGQMHSTLMLHSLRSPADAKNLTVRPDFYRGDWLVGFGWDQHGFPEKKYPTRFDLDAIYPDRPVAFSRADGHAVWVNTKALQVCGLLRPVREWNLPAGGEALADEGGESTGILIDRAMELIFAHIPPDSLQTKKKFIKIATSIFNREGFTHLRDMSGDEEQWQALCELEEAKEFTLYLDQNFSFEKAEDFEKALELCVRASKEKHSYLRVRGTKFYLDGALGSEGAAVSVPYGNGRGDGFFLWQAEQVSEWMRKTWEKGFEVSIHAIGDRASHLVAVEAKKIWDSGLNGFLNVEHAEVMRSETLSLLQGHPVRLHMQPCHWLSDRKWLRQKLPGLMNAVFPWQEAFERKIPLSWGSDAPIEAPSLMANRQALLESQDLIRPFPEIWWKPHEHPDPNWGAECRTELSDDRIAHVWFDGKDLR